MNPFPAALLCAALAGAATKPSSAARTSRAARRSRPAAKASRAPKIPPAAARAYARGEEFLAAGRYDDALRELERCLKLAPKYPPALARRGVAYSRLGRVDDALHDFAAAIALRADQAPALRPEIVAAHVRRGRVRLEEGHIKEALADLFSAIRSDPGDARGYAAVAEVARQAGRYDTCAAYAGRAIDLAPSAPLLESRAACLGALGKSARARKDLERARELARPEPAAAPR